MLAENLTGQIPEWVAPYVNLPFADYNCWQLVCLVYDKQFNKKIETYQTEYKDAFDKNSIKKIYQRELNVWQKADTPKLGDVIVLNVNAQPWHAGLIVANNLMLHTERNLESVIERFNGIIWKQKIVGYYRYCEKT